MDLVRAYAVVRSNMLYEIYRIFVTEAEVPEKDFTEPTSAPAGNLHVGSDLENTQDFIMAGAGFKIHGTTQALRVLSETPRVSN